VAAGSVAEIVRLEVGLELEVEPVVPLAEELAVVDPGIELPEHPLNKRIPHSRVIRAALRKKIVPLVNCFVAGRGRR
jgi:hypothetical protein